VPHLGVALDDGLDLHTRHGTAVRTRHSPEEDVLLLDAEELAEVLLKGRRKRQDVARGKREEGGDRVVDGDRGGDTGGKGASDQHTMRKRRTMALCCFLQGKVEAW